MAKEFGKLSHDQFAKLVSGLPEVPAMEYSTSPRN